MADFQRTLTAPDGLRRAVILRRPDGFYQIDFERFDDSVVSGVGGTNDPFWRPADDEVVTTTLQDAERRASAWLGLAQPA